MSIFRAFQSLRRPCTTSNGRFGSRFRLSTIIEIALDTVFELAVVENLGFTVGILTISLHVLLLEIKYFRFNRPYCYFQLSVVFKITVLVAFMVDSLRFAVKRKQI